MSLENVQKSNKDQNHLNGHKTGGQKRKIQPDHDSGHSEPWIPQTGSGAIC